MRHTGVISDAEMPIPISSTNVAKEANNELPSTKGNFRGPDLHCTKSVPKPEPGPESGWTHSRRRGPWYQESFSQANFANAHYVVCLGALSERFGSSLSSCC